MSQSQFLSHSDGFDEEGHPNSSSVDAVHTATVHPQGSTAANLEVDYVGSSTMKRLIPDTDTLTNAPSNDQKIIPIGATVADGVVSI